MEILEGAAAFAVVMIVLSTIVTGITEAFLRLLAVRQQVLADAIERLIVDEIVPVAKSGLTGVLDVNADGTLSAADVDALKKKLTLSPLTEKTARIPFATMRFGHESITTYALLQRLAKSELGDALAKKARTELRAALTDIARTYERYAAASAERFRYKAHRYTAIIAVLFAFGTNVDAGRVFVFLMDNPQIRQDLVSRAEIAKAEYDAAARRVEEAGAAAGGPSADPEAVEKLAEAVGAVSSAIEATRSELNLPIGPSYYPFCGSEFAEITIFGYTLEGVFASSGCAGTQDRTLFGWAAYTLLAGILIGLGGPFWYQVYATLSRIIGSAKSIVGGETIDENAADQPASRRALTEEDIVTTFEIARAGRGA